MTSLETTSVRILARTKPTQNPRVTGDLVSQNVVRRPKKTKAPAMTPHVVTDGVISSILQVPLGGSDADIGGEFFGKDDEDDDDGDEGNEGDAVFRLEETFFPKSLLLGTGSLLELPLSKCDLLISFLSSPFLFTDVLYFCVLLVSFPISS